MLVDTHICTHVVMTNVKSFGGIVGFDNKVTTVTLVAAKRESIYHFKDERKHAFRLRVITL